MDKDKQVEPRGIRNNNPGNIRIGAKWIGMCETQNDGSFVQFDDVRFGIRAMARTIKTYYNIHNLHTVEAIISRWAPSSENETEAYIDAVADRIGVGRKDDIDVLHNNALLGELVEAIIHHENGQQPYPYRLIDEGIRLA